MTDQELCARLREVLPLARGASAQEILENQCQQMIYAQKHWQEAQLAFAEAIRQDPLVAKEQEKMKTPFDRWCDRAREWEH
jgi:hypothetical protein